MPVHPQTTRQGVQRTAAAAGDHYHASGVRVAAADAAPISPRVVVPSGGTGHGSAAEQALLTSPPASGCGLAVLADQAGWLAELAGVATATCICRHCLKQMVWKPKYSLSWDAAEFCSRVCKVAAATASGIDTEGAPGAGAAAIDAGVLQSNSKLRKMAAAAAAQTTTFPPPPP